MERSVDKAAHTPLHTHTVQKHHIDPCPAQQQLIWGHPLLSDRVLLGMWPLLLDYDCLYYPITALFSGPHPVLEDAGTVFNLTLLLYATFSCLLRNINGKKKGGVVEETKKWVRRAICCQL